jgi:hypothetical protein
LWVTGAQQDGNGSATVGLRTVKRADCGPTSENTPFLGTWVNTGKNWGQRGAGAHRAGTSGLFPYARPVGYSGPPPNKPPAEASREAAPFSMGGKRGTWFSQLFLTTSTPRS